MIVLLTGTHPEITSSLWQLRRLNRARGKCSRSSSLIEMSRTYRLICPKPQKNVPINNAPTVKVALSTAARDRAAIHLATAFTGGEPQEHRTKINQTGGRLYSPTEANITSGLRNRHCAWEDGERGEEGGEGGGGGLQEAGDTTLQRERKGGMDERKLVRNRGRRISRG